MQVKGIIVSTPGRETKTDGENYRDTRSIPGDKAVTMERRIAGSAGDGKEMGFLLHLSQAKRPRRSKARESTPPPAVAATSITVEISSVANVEVEGSVSEMRSVVLRAIRRALRWS